jgi:hypothetical protein
LRSSAEVTAPWAATGTAAGGGVTGALTGGRAAQPTSTASNAPQANRDSEFLQIELNMSDRAVTRVHRTPSLR